MYLEQVFTQILKMSMTAGWCILAVLALHLIFYKVPKKYLYALWLVVAFRLICPVSISTPVGIFQGEQTAVGQTVSEQTSVEQAAVLRSDNSSKVQPMENSQQISIVGGEQQEMPARPIIHVAGEKRVLRLASRIWVIGMAALAGYYVFSLWRIRRKLKKAVLAEEQNHHPDWGKIPIYECDSLPSPFAIGMLHPKIYLPYGMKPENREMVLLHEQYHIRRKDQLVKAMACLLLAVYWFHPLVWTAWAVMCRDMEMSCDEKVLELIGKARKKEYSMALLQFASEKPIQSLSMPLGFGEPNVKSRIQHVLKYKKAAVGTGVAAVILIVAVFLLLGSNRSNPSGNNTGTNDGQTKSRSSTVTVDTETQAAELLYEARNPYVGDASANGKLLGAIAKARPDSVFASLSYKTELQTSEEPYEFHFLLETDEVDETVLDEDLSVTAVLMLALTDNLGEVQWYGTDEQIISYVDIDRAQSLLGIDNLKAYAESPEKVRELLKLVEQMDMENTTEEETQTINTAEHRAGFQNASLHWYFPDSYKDSMQSCYTEAEAEAHAQKALEELYDLTGYLVKECYYFSHDDGTVDFAMSSEDLEHGRIFLSRCFADVPGAENSIQTMNLASDLIWSPTVSAAELARQVEMPGVVLDFPDDESAAIWYVTHSGQYNGQPVKKVYQNYSADLSIWTVVTANGETYEISLDADWNSFSNLAGPYPDENIQH